MKKSDLLIYDNLVTEYSVMRPFKVNDGSFMDGLLDQIVDEFQLPEHSVLVHGLGIPDGLDLEGCPLQEASAQWFRDVLHEIAVAQNLYGVDQKSYLFDYKTLLTVHGFSKLNTEEFREAVKGDVVYTLSFNSMFSKSRGFANFKINGNCITCFCWIGDFIGSFEYDLQQGVMSYYKSSKVVKIDSLCAAASCSVIDLGDETCTSDGCNMELCGEVLMLDSKRITAIELGAKLFRALEKVVFGTEGLEFALNGDAVIPISESFADGDDNTRFPGEEHKAIVKEIFRSNKFTEN